MLLSKKEDTGSRKQKQMAISGELALEEAMDLL